jgi:hypothetical protein
MPVPSEENDPQPRTPDNDVMAMLRLNKEREAQREINGPITHVPKKSRRLRDYLLSLIGGNLFIIAVVWINGLNPVTLIYGFSGIILLSAGLSWVMFQVMDDY